MGLFSKKENILCSFCGKKAGITRTDLQDGYICSSCKKNLISQNFTLSKQHTVADIQQHINTIQSKYQFMQNEFVCEQSESTSLAVDTKHNKFFVGNIKKIPTNPELYDFNQLICYELVEDGNTITQGGTGITLASGVLFGVPGAIIGNSLSKKKSKPTVCDLHIRMSIDDIYVKQITIKFISSETQKDSLFYPLIKQAAEKDVSLLDYIMHYNERVQSSSPSIQTSDADEIIKLKSLLDSGILTQEEFDAAKKKLLQL